MFPDLDISQIWIRLNAPTTLAVEPIPNDVETDDEMLEIDEPSGMAENPKEPDEQATNSLANP